MKIYQRIKNSNASSINKNNYSQFLHNKYNSILIINNKIINNVVITK